MNPILQNTAAAVTTFAVTVGGMAGLDTRYLDGAEASAQFQDKKVAEHHLATQLAVNTVVAATLIDLRVQQYRYVAQTTDSAPERQHAEGQVKRAVDDLLKLSATYAEHLAQSPVALLGGGG